MPHLLELPDEIIMFVLIFMTWMDRRTLSWVNRRLRGMVLSGHKAFECHHLTVLLGMSEPITFPSTQADRFKSYDRLTMPPPTSHNVWPDLTLAMRKELRDICIPSKGRRVPRVHSGAGLSQLVQASPHLERLWVLDGRCVTRSLFSALHASKSLRVLQVSLWRYASEEYSKLASNFLHTTTSCRGLRSVCIDCPGVSFACAVHTFRDTCVVAPHVKELCVPVECGIRMTWLDKLSFIFPSVVVLTVVYTEPAELAVPFDDMERTVRLAFPKATVNFEPFDAEAPLALFAGKA